MKHASKTIGFHNFSIAGALKQFVFIRASLAEQLQLMKPNGLAAPANENLIKTYGFAGLAVKSLPKGLSLHGAACVS